MQCNNKRITSSIKEPLEDALSKNSMIQSNPKSTDTAAMRRNGEINFNIHIQIARHKYNIKRTHNHNNKINIINIKQTCKV